MQPLIPQPMMMANPMMMGNPMMADPNAAFVAGQMQGQMQGRMQGQMQAAASMPGQVVVAAPQVRGCFSFAGSSDGLSRLPPRLKSWLAPLLWPPRPPSSLLLKARLWLRSPLATRLPCPRAGIRCVQPFPVVA
jgi:hypothetical protein